MSSIHDGEIEISPALNAAEIKKFNEALFALVKQTYTSATNPTVRRLATLVGSAKDFRDEMRLGLEVKTTERETDEGTLLVRTSDRLSYPSTEYCTQLSPQSIVDTLRRTFPKHILTGTVVSVDKDYNSAEKVTVHNGEVFAVKGVVAVAWEDGSKPTPMSSF